MINLLAVSQCNLQGQLVGDFYYYRASEIFDCYNTVPVDQATVTEATKAALEMVEFYHGTDIALSTDPSVIGKVNLKGSLQQFSTQQWNSDFQFQTSMARLFVALHDGHTAYTLPSGYLSTLHIPFVLGSSMDNGQQVIFIRERHALFAAYSQGQTWSSVQVGNVVTAINGQPAVAYLSKLLGDNGSSKSNGADLNEYLNNPFAAGISSTRSGYQATTMQITVAGTSHTLPIYSGRGGPQLTTAVIVAGNRPAATARGAQVQEAPVTPNDITHIRQNREAYKPIPPIADQRAGIHKSPEVNSGPNLPPNPLSDIARDLHNADKADKAASAKKEQERVSKRSVQQLASSDLWNQGKIVAQYPQNTNEPNIVCSSFETNAKPVMYLYIGTFSPSTANLRGCDVIKVLFRFLKVIEACNDYAIAFSPRITELILDVRGNGGGFLILYSTAIEYLTPKLQYPAGLRNASRTSSDFRISPASAASTKGASEYHLTDFTKGYISLIQSAVVGGEDYNALRISTGESLYNEPLASTNMQQAQTKLNDLFNNAPKKSRAAGSPEVFVVPKVASLFESLFELKDSATFAQCNFAANEKINIPTKGFATIKVLSLGACASACSQTVKLLRKASAVTVVSAGGITGEKHRVSSTTNAPFFEWKSWVATAAKNNVNKQLTPITRTNAALTFSLAAFYTDPSASISDEFLPVYADHVFPFWPPYSAATELRMFQQTAALSSTASTNWVEFEAGTYKVPGTVVVSSTAPTAAPTGASTSSSDDSDVKLRNTLLISIFSGVFVIVVIVIVYMCCCRKSSSEEEQKGVELEENRPDSA